MRAFLLCVLCAVFSSLAVAAVSDEDLVALKDIGLSQLDKALVTAVKNRGAECLFEATPREAELLAKNLGAHGIPFRVKHGKIEQRDGGIFEAGKAKPLYLTYVRIVSADATKAELSVGWIAGGDNAVRLKIVLEKRGEKWEIVENVLVLIS